MAAAPDEDLHDDHGHEAPLRGRPDGTTAAHIGHGPADDHDGHGHQSDHGGHDEHGTGGDAWVVPPLVIGLVIGLLIAIVFGLGSGAVAFG